MTSAEKDWTTGEKQVQPKRVPLTKLTSINRDTKNELWTFIQDTDSLHGKYGLCMKYQNGFFLEKWFFPLSFRMYFPYLACSHQFWTWIAQCPLRGCRITVSPDVVPKSWSHSDWRGLWSWLPPHCLAQVPVTLMSLKLPRRDGLPVTAPLRDLRWPGPVI